MTIKHHLSDSLLMAYSAGQLSEAFNLVVATHVSLCDECRARLESFDAVGGALLEAERAVAVSSVSLEATMQRIRRDGKGPIVAGTRPDTAQQPVAPRRARHVFPEPLRAYVGGDLDSVAWRPAGGGVQQAILISQKGNSVRLLRIPGGVAVPDHGHRGTELTQVLKGAFRDDAQVFGPGDIEIATQDDHHQPVAEPGEDCICLAATDAPLRFNALLPKVAQPFLRI